MALRDQPYLPLYIQDFLTDEKLAECSAESTGVYIRIMCIMHKSQNYGKILLKQKHKQTDNQIVNFALFLFKHLPYDLDVIENSLYELIEEEVLFVDNDSLCQKRMIKDYELSIKRSNSGKKGGNPNLKNDVCLSKRTSKKNKIAKANGQANTEDEIEDVNEDNIEDVKEEKRVTGKKETKSKKQKTELIFPYNSELFIETWNILLSTPKWKKKIPHSLQIALNNLGKYQEEFSIMLINKAIENDWQGVTYADTDEQYQKWLNKNQHGNTEIRKSDSNYRQNTTGNNAEDKKRSVDRLADMAETILQNS